MIFTRTAIEGSFLIDPEPHTDERGSFARVWCRKEFMDHGIEVEWLQANAATSRLAGTLRGLHYQPAPAHEAKLVRCSRGALFDVVVDVREHSPSRFAWFGVELADASGRSVYVPAGCAHGYLTLRDDTEITYFTSAFYVAGKEHGICFDDPLLRIEWPGQPTVIAERDRCWPKLQGANPTGDGR
jgi:dTDP-4-dehydrorhamnose 3,5-epimerase